MAVAYLIVLVPTRSGHLGDRIRVTCCSSQGQCRGPVSLSIPLVHRHKVALCLLRPVYLENNGDLFDEKRHCPGSDVTSDGLCSESNNRIRSMFCILRNLL
jgi:hypothetical protein